MSLTRKRFFFFFRWDLFPFGFIYNMNISCVFSLWTATELQNLDYEFDSVKEEVDVQVGGNNGKAGSVDHMYMKVNFINSYDYTT